MREYFGENNMFGWEQLQTWFTTKNGFCMHDATAAVTTRFCVGTAIVDDGRGQ